MEKIITVITSVLVCLMFRLDMCAAEKIRSPYLIRKTFERRQSRVTELEAPDWEVCQNFCDTVFEADCNSIIFHENEEKCLIIRSVFEDYTKDCKFVGASEDTPSNCLRDDVKYPDLCKRILQSECTFEDELAHNISSITQSDECLQLSLAYGDSYYTHDKEDETCITYKGEKRTCNVVRSLRHTGSLDCDL